MSKVIMFHTRFTLVALGSLKLAQSSSECSQSFKPSILDSYSACGGHNLRQCSPSMSNKCSWSSRHFSQKDGNISSQKGLLSHSYWTSACSSTCRVCLHSCAAAMRNSSYQSPHSFWNLSPSQLTHSECSKSGVETHIRSAAQPPPCTL